MAETYRILVLDDDVEVADTVSDSLIGEGYLTTMVHSVDDALAALQSQEIDLVISDVHMPVRTGFDFCVAARKLLGENYVPIILLTGGSNEFSKGLDTGADDFVTKPPRLTDLFAKVRSLLRIRSLQRRNLQQAQQLQQWNLDLENRVQRQVSELHRLEKLKAFFSSGVAELIASEKSEELLKTHRREITTLFVDLRGFTRFSETASPDDVCNVLNEYYSTVGKVASAYVTTVGNIAGDGMLFFFNDPIEVEEHQYVALSMAIDLRHALDEAIIQWQARGFSLGFGIGLAEGLATIGGVGFNQFWSYTVIGSTVNLAARLCGEAKNSEILISDRFRSRVEGRVDVEPLGIRELKGLKEGILVFNVKNLISHRTDSVA